MSLPSISQNLTFTALLSVGLLAAQGQGTPATLQLRLGQTIHTRSVRAGDRITATLIAPADVDGTTFPIGSQVVATVQRPSGPSSLLTLSFNSLDHHAEHASINGTLVAASPELATDGPPTGQPFPPTNLFATRSPVPTDPPQPLSKVGSSIPGVTLSSGVLSSPHPFAIYKGYRLVVQLAQP